MSETIKVGETPEQQVAEQPVLVEESAAEVAKVAEQPQDEASAPSTTTTDDGCPDDVKDTGTASESKEPAEDAAKPEQVKVVQDAAAGVDDAVKMAEDAAVAMVGKDTLKMAEDAAAMVGGMDDLKAGLQAALEAVGGEHVAKVLSVLSALQEGDAKAAADALGADEKNAIDTLTSIVGEETAALAYAALQTGSPEEALAALGGEEKLLEALGGEKALSAFAAYKTALNTYEAMQSGDAAGAMSAVLGKRQSAALLNLVGGADFVNKITAALEDLSKIDFTKILDEEEKLADEEIEWTPDGINAQLDAFAENVLSFKESPMLDKAPEWIKKYAIPFSMVGVPYIKKLVPIVFMLIGYWTQFKTDYALDVYPMLVGLVFLLAGDCFLLTMTAFAAFKTAGWPPIQEGVATLYKDFKRATNALNRHTPELSAEALQSNPSDVIVSYVKKAAAVMTCCEPASLSKTFHGMHAGLLVVTSMVSPSVRNFTLGHQLGSTIHKVVAPPTMAIVAGKIPFEAAHKWVEEGLSYGCQAGGVALAFIVSGLVATFYSATKGANMIMDGVTHMMTVRYGMAPLSHKLTGYATMGLVAVGCLCQVVGYMPSLMYLALSPLMAVESIMQMIFLADDAGVDVAGVADGVADAVM